MDKALDDRFTPVARRPQRTASPLERDPNDPGPVALLASIREWRMESVQTAISRRLP